MYRRDIHGETLRRLLCAARFEGARVLEIGCGPGRVTAMYAHLTDLAVAVEPDGQAARQAARQVPSTRLARASGMRLPFAPGVFDTVLFTLSLHHHPDPNHALEEARRTLAPGGRILALEPLPEGEIQRLCLAFEDEDHRLEAAERALGRARMEALSRRVFSTDWVFDDFESLAAYAFGHYGLPRDTARIEAMRAFLGPRAGGHPIHLTDTLRLTCLA